jgi:polyhydroxybutyrate depolymerase
MPRRHRRLATLALVVALIAAGCAGDDGDEGADSTTTATTAAGPTSSSTAPAGVEAVPSPGCGGGDVAEVAARATAIREERRTLDVDGVARWYLVTVPEAHDGAMPVPLVLDFHGLAEGAEIHTKMSAFSDVAEDKGFVVAFPQGTGAPVQWKTTTADPANPDLAYVTRLLDTLGQELCLDESRVYATGLSMGAMMSSTLACTMADRFAAIAPVAGVADPDPCEPGRPVPVLAFHGTADEILLFNGGVGDKLGDVLGGQDQPGTTTTTTPVDLNGSGYPETVAIWAERNGCDPEATDKDVSDEVVKRVYECPEGGDVEFFIVKGGGHSWPGSEFSKGLADIIGPTTFDIDASEEIWSFFERFRLPT